MRPVNNIYSSLSLIQGCPVGRHASHASIFNCMQQCDISNDVSYINSNKTKVQHCNSVTSSQYQYIDERHHHHHPRLTSAFAQPFPVSTKLIQQMQSNINYTAYIDCSVLLFEICRPSRISCHLFNTSSSSRLCLLFSRLYLSISMDSIDVSILEGGGQVIRVSTCLCSLLTKPIHAFNVRANRPKPGLQAQHLNGVQLVARMTGAKHTASVSFLTMVMMVMSAERSTVYI